MSTNPEELFGGTGKFLSLIELICLISTVASLWPVTLDQVAVPLRGESIAT